MRRIEDYKRNAEDCRWLAERMPGKQGEQLLQMAEQWETLAAERIAQLAADSPADLQGNA